MLTAAGASVCCLLPFTLLAVGLGGAWVSQLMIVEPFQPYLIAITVAVFALAGKEVFRATKLTSEQGYCRSETTADRTVWLYFACATVALVLLTSEHWIVLLA